jgi:hypothetical protein
MSVPLYLGTSPWAEKALIETGRFYPSELKGTPARLAFYA